MEMFIVRQHGLRASLVTAKDEESLVEMLRRQQVPPISWQRYDGPLWLELDLNADVFRTDQDGDSERFELTTLEQYDVEVGPYFARIPVVYGEALADEVEDMERAVCRAAFPAVAAALGGDEGALRTAVRDEFAVELRERWRLRARG